MVAEGVAPVRPRRGRRLVVAGSVVVAAALVVGIASGVFIVRAVGGPLAEAFTSPSRPTPVEVRLTLDEGSYTVFELVGRRSSRGPVTTTESEEPTVTPDLVQVTGADGVTIGAEDPSSSETLTRNDDVYTGAARFAVPEPGEYRVTIAGPPGEQVVIAPSFGSGFGEVLPWFLTGLACFAALVAGVILVIVGAVKGRRPPHPTTPAAPLPRTTPPPGWYPAPDAPHRRRYWDGRTWTTHLH